MRAFAYLRTLIAGMLRIRTLCQSRQVNPRDALDSSLENRRQEESNKLRASGGKQGDDLLNGFVGAVVSGFEFAGRLVSGVRAVMEATVGEWTAKPFVEEQEEQCHLDAFWREPVGVAGAVTL